MDAYLEQGSNEAIRRDGDKVIRFWAAADTWDRATITVRVNYREWMAAFASLVEVVDVGAERRYRPSSGGKGIILPHVEVLIVYRDLPEPRTQRVNPGERAKPKFADRECRYCGKTFSPSGSIQRFCDEVCRSWYNLEQAEKRAAEKGLKRDEGGL